MRDPADERGSAPVEALFAMVLVVFLALAVVEIAFVLYARNVVLAAAHEAARTAVEMGRTEEEAAAVARDSVSRAAGGIVRDLRVDADFHRGYPSTLVRLRVRAVLEGIGPVPVRIPMTAHASASSENPDS